MKLYRFGERIESERPIRLAIGAFDGIHAGHRSLLGIDPTGEEDVYAVYFDPLPAAVFDPKFPGAIRSARQRVDIFAKLGVTGLLRIDFSKEFSRMMASSFIETLVDTIGNLKRVVVGEGFRTGRDGSADCAALKRMLAPRGVIPDVRSMTTMRGVPVSSTMIRDWIIGGEFEAAREALGGDSYRLDLIDAPRRERDGLVEYDLSRRGRLLPAAGIYATTHGEAEASALTVRTDRILDEIEFVSKLS